MACVTMLLDHVGAILLLAIYYENPRRDILELYRALRLIGRISFPIYCFLLSEGSFHTRNPMRYGLRLALCAIISEIPYDLAYYGEMNWAKQNVMVSLFLGFGALETMKRFPRVEQKLLVCVPFVILGELAAGNYGWKGIALMILFSLTREMPRGLIVQFFGMWFLFSPGHGMMLNWFNGFSVTTQELCVLSLFPIALYNGEKRSRSKWMQWGFYLFYPAHLMILYLIGRH